MITAFSPFYKTTLHLRSPQHLMQSSLLVSPHLLHTYTEMPGPRGLWRSVSRNEVLLVLTGWCRGETRSVRRDIQRKYGHVSKCCCNKEWKSNSSLIRPAGIDVLPHIWESVVRPFIRIDKSDSDCIWFGSSNVVDWFDGHFVSLQCNTSSWSCPHILLFGTYNIPEKNIQWWKMISLKARTNNLFFLRIFQENRGIFPGEKCFKFQL